MKQSQISDEALQVLSAGDYIGRMDGAGQFFLPKVQLERKLYSEVNKVLETFGGTWNRKTQSHIFDENPGDKLNDAIATGSYVRLDKNGYFPTPKELAFTLVEMLEDEYGGNATILEPSVGDGNLAYAICGEQFVGNPLIVGVEPNMDLLKKALERVNAVTGRMTGVHSTFEEFAESTGYEAMYDAVVMNPPFERGQDAKHIAMAAGLLKPGGELVAIAGYGMRFRQDMQYRITRDLLTSAGATIIDNDEGAFKSSGTGVRTVRIHYRKPRN